MNYEPIGLYVHIPFCSKICHYCDFAKTSNYSEQHVTEYFNILEQHLQAWSQLLKNGQKFSTVFFGGGTPGLFSKEYKRLIQLILEFTDTNAEITLEANPNNITEQRILEWRHLGFNRLSIGIQSFDAEGLKKLTRDHTANESINALELASKYFPKSNGDLIYGWPGQSLKSWESDIKLLASTGINHMSLYALTFEGNTPFARSERRGIIKANSDDELADKYQIACHLLSELNYTHDEISNWSMNGQTSEHNWLYWRGQKFIGIGAGAHGYIDGQNKIGLRYSYTKDLRQFLRQLKSIEMPKNQETVESLKILENTCGSIDSERSLDSWLYEYVGCALRTKDGIDLNLIANMGFRFEPNSNVKRALSEGLLRLSGTCLIAKNQEWFRETAWSYEICASCQGQGATSSSIPSLT